MGIRVKDIRISGDQGEVYLLISRYPDNLSQR